MNDDNLGRRILNLLLWGETRFFEFAIGAQLLVRLAYGRMMHGYPLFMLAFGLAVALYVIYASVDRSIAHRHRATSLLMVFYSVYVYTASTRIGFPAAKTWYYLFNMVLPALYLKWRTYREQIYREAQGQ